MGDREPVEFRMRQNPRRAALGTGAVIAVRWALAPWLHNDAPFLPFLAAVLAAAWLGGLRPGFVATLLGALALLYAILALLGGGSPTALSVASLTALLLIAFGLWTRRAGREFQMVDETAGADVSHLMVALANLHRLYAVQYVIGWVGLVLLIVVLVFGYFAAPAH